MPRNRQRKLARLLIIIKYTSCINVFWPQKPNSNSVSSKSSQEIWRKPQRGSAGLQEVIKHYTLKDHFRQGVDRAIRAGAENHTIFSVVTSWNYSTKQYREFSEINR